MLELQLAQHGMSAVLVAAVDVQPDTTVAKERLDAAIGTLLRRAQEAGRLRPDVSAADLRQLVSGVELAQDRRDPRAADRAMAHLGIVLDGLRHG
jgi:hypothetical protein